MILDKIHCGLDIGLYSLKASLIRVKSPNRYELLETQEVPTQGLSKSNVSDLGELSESIHRVLKNLSGKSHGKFKDVHLGLGGNPVEVRYSKAMIPLMDKTSKVITTGDLKRVNKQACLLGIKIDEEILHDFPQQYVVDDANRILNPAGLYGRKLGVTSLLIVSQANLLGNITKAVNQAGFEVANIFFSSLAAAQAALSRDHIQRGSLLIDIGATTTNILFFKDGFLRHLDILPVGGHHLTENIAESLRVPVELAEQIKQSHALVIDEELKNNGDILVKREEGYLTVKRKAVCAALDAPIAKILDGIQKTLTFSHIQEKVSMGVVIVGGGALLSGLLEKVEQATHLPVQIGKINIEGIALRNAAVFTASAGLIQQSGVKPFFEPLTAASPRNWAGRISYRVKELYEEYF